MDRQSIETLVRAHQAELYRYLLYLGAEESAAEDLAQDVFVAALQNRTVGSLSDLGSRAAWLRSIARHIFYRHISQKKNDPVQVDSSFLESAEGYWKNEFLRHEDGFDWALAFRDCLGRLPEKSRSVLNLRYEEKKSRAEMAKLLELTQNGVKSVLRRLRLGLADCVEERLKMEDAHVTG